MSTIEVDHNIDGLDTMLRVQRDMRVENKLSMTRSGYAYVCPQDFVLQHGTPYDPATFETREGEPKACYRNSLLAAAENDWTYVEGYAFGSSLPLDIHHAWCVKPDGTPVECTWEDVGLAYRGVAFPLPLAMAAHEATGSVLDDWQRDWPILKERWQGC